MSPRYLTTAILFAAVACGNRRHVVADTATPLQTLTVAPAPALVFETDSAAVYFDTASAFKLVAAAIADTSTPEGGRQRYYGWPDSARRLFATGSTSFHLHDPFVAGNLMTQTAFALFDKRHNRWAHGAVKNVYVFTCGSLCGEAHDRFRFSDGYTFLDILRAVA